MTAAAGPVARNEENRLLTRLSAGTYGALIRHGELVTLAARDVLYEPFERVEFVHFPISAVLSMVKSMANGDAVETMTIGCEGMTSISVFLGADASSSRCLTQIGGAAKRIPVGVFRTLVLEHAELRDVFGRYALAAISQISQSVVCNRMHPVEQRCARWLLTTRDRAGVDEFALTHDFLAQMLGVRRASVTDVEAGLRARRLIQASRGRVRIVDRAGLEAVSCECYQAVREEYNRLLELPTPPVLGVTP